MQLTERIVKALQDSGYKYYACDVPHDGKCENCRACLHVIIDRELGKDKALRSSQQPATVTLSEFTLNELIIMHEEVDRRVQEAEGLGVEHEEMKVTIGLRDKLTEAVIKAREQPVAMPPKPEGMQP